MMAKKQKGKAVDIVKFFRAEFADWVGRDDFELDIQMVKLEDLEIPRYQRAQRLRVLNKLMRKRLNALAAGLLIINLRENGSMFIIDGNHRSCFLAKKNRTTWPAFMIAGLTEKEEAKLWEAFNEDRTNPSPSEIMNDRVYQGDTEALELRQIVHNHGLKLDCSCDAKRDGVTVASIKTLKEAMQKGVLDPLLYFVTTAWPDNVEALRGSLLKGITTLLLSFEDRSSIDKNRLVNAMKQFGPIDLLVQAASNAKLARGRMTQKIAELVAREYNKNLKKNKIEEIIHAKRGRPKLVDRNQRKAVEV